MLNNLRSIFLVSAAALAAPAFAQNTIADLVVAASGGADAGVFDSNTRDYDVLLTALTTANLVGAVSDPNASLTVFAPNDAAFIRLAQDLGFTGTDEAGAWTFLVGALTTLGNGDPVPVLTDVLLYHVAPGEVDFLDVIFKSIFRRTIDTLLTGATIRPFFIQLIDNEPDLGNAFVRWPANVQASNGIIHTISRVLIPLDLP